jgi:hypothetical protein
VLLYIKTLQALAELWIHLAIPAAGFSQAEESLGMHFAFQVMQKDSAQ